MSDLNSQQLSLFSQEQEVDFLSAKSVLKSVFGHSHFRGPQEKIIRELLNGQNVLALMPTGGGKSLCYQLPSLVRKGMGIVVSPLISLMQDQVETLKELGVRARFLNSSLSLKEQRKIEQEIKNGEVDLIYLSPERIVKAATLSLLKMAEVSLIAIDEAHCVSRWGHDFRPEYLQLSKLRKHFPKAPRIALTASADKRTQIDILNHLDLKDAVVFRASFDRPNITYMIEQRSENPRVSLTEFLREHKGETGIIYCLSRKKVEEIAEYLNEVGIEAYGYHAGMDRKTRTLHQQHFMEKENVIIVATIAFGMGIDRPDVRFVVHMDMPRNIESYYQETGRAGRDGQESIAYLMYGISDLVVMKSMISQSVSSIERLHLEHGGLEEMLALCETKNCRRKSILLSFDEVYPENCGKCDNCINGIQQSELFDAQHLAPLVLKMIHLKKQRYDEQDFIDFFRGVITLKIREQNDFDLEGFGTLAHASEKGIKFLFRQLSSYGLIKYKYDRKVTLTLSQGAVNFLKNPFPLFLLEDPIHYGKKSKKTKTLKPKKVVRTYAQQKKGSDKELFEKLKELRRKLSKNGKIPAYKIFNDKTLLQMSQIRPKSLDDMIDIEGVGNYKLKKWGKVFLQEIN